MSLTHFGIRVGGRRGGDHEVGRDVHGKSFSEFVAHHTVDFFSRLAKGLLSKQDLSYDMLRRNMKEFYSPGKRVAEDMKNSVQSFQG